MLCRMAVVAVPVHRWRQRKRLTHAVPHGTTGNIAAPNYETISERYSVAMHYAKNTEQNKTEILCIWLL